MATRRKLGADIAHDPRDCGWVGRVDLGDEENFSRHVGAVATWTRPRIRTRSDVHRRAASDIVVDGVLDDAAWAGAATIDLAFEVTPGDNTPAPVKTTARIAYTDDAVLIAFHAEDPDPSKIRAFLRDRDALYGDDFVGVMLDTFDDQRRAYEFFVNPFGVQADLIKEEATNSEDDSWDGIWSSAGRITKDGYDVEMIHAVRERASVPLIASGGAGRVEHFVEAVEAGADAVLAASVFHFGELTIGEVKAALRAAGHEVR